MGYFLFAYNHDLLSSLPTFIVALIWMGAAAKSFNIEQSNDLQKNFVSLGNLIGKTDAEIIAVVGSPNTISRNGDNVAVYLWNQPKYQIALSFHNNICTGIMNETIHS